MRITRSTAAVIGAVLLLFGAGSAPALAHPSDPPDPGEAEEVGDLTDGDEVSEEANEVADVITDAKVESDNVDGGAADSGEESEPPVDSPVDEVPPDQESFSANREPHEFVDVTSSNAFKDEITWLGNTTISQGWKRPDGSREFRPTHNISREAMAAFMYRLAELEDLSSVRDYVPPAESEFPDVDTDHEFYTEISWLAAQQITQGYPDGTFRPTERITREAISAFMYRYATESGRSSDVSLPSKPLFSDTPAKHAFYKEITWMAQNGITTGYSRPYGCYEYRPRGKATREAIAAFLYRLTHEGVETIKPDCNPPPPPKLPPVKRTVEYVVTTNGNITTNVDTFIKQVDETLNSSLGWRRAGVKFKRVKSGGSLTVVLANASKVKGYAPSICDNYYSCRVGRYAIINEDRWKGATPTWNNAKQSLRDYRHMVVNHEVGHWLDNRHASCGGKGKKAPVMQQQSVNLAGCKPNPWPLDSEIKSQADRISGIPWSASTEAATKE